LPKNGLEYFSIDVDMDQDDKIYMLEAEIGELAFGRFIKLLMAIYREGYYKKWGEAEQLVFSGKKNIPINELKDLILCALNRSLFDLNLFQRYSILTSAGIQKRFIKACENRIQIVIEEKYRLYDIDDFSDKIKSKIKLIKSNLMGIKSDIKPKIPGSGTQSKESKVKKREERQPPLNPIKSGLNPEAVSEKVLGVIEPYSDRANTFVANHLQKLVDLCKAEGLNTVLGALHVCATTRVDKLKFFIDDFQQYKRTYLRENAGSQNAETATQRKLDELRKEGDEARESHDENKSLVADFNKKIGKEAEPRGSPESPPPEDDFVDDIPEVGEGEKPDEKELEIY